MGEIRNFCIIAHIDHGKSTLADRMLEITGTIKKSGKTQVLDKMDLEQERGITIKLTPVRMQWKGYEFNLIDTPGHVDFQYEVSRSLAAVEGAILLVDATQGIQAQTLSTLYMAMEYGLEIIPVLNKIDLPAANPERVAMEVEKLVGIDKSEIISVSAKTGENVDLVLDAVIERFKTPAQLKEKNHAKLWGDLSVSNNNVTRALIFDSVYDKYRGVVIYVKMVDGSFKAKSKVRLIYSQKDFDPVEVGHFDPDYCKDEALVSGQIGYIVTGQKSVRDAKIGDTVLIVDKKLENQQEYLKYAIPGFKRMKPFVYAGVYPMDSEEYEKLKESFDKLSLNDSAVEYEYESSKALGYGFRTGFLGTLHMDIIKERLSREFDMDTIFTTPNVIYLVTLKTLSSVEKVKTGSNVNEIIKSDFYKLIVDKDPADSKLSSDQLYNKYEDKLKNWLMVRSGADMPDPGVIEDILEPYAEVEIVGPNEFAGNIMALTQEYRGELKSMEYIDEVRVLWRYELPMGEIIVDFYDRLKSSTKGYATMNYEFKHYRKSDLLRLDIFINGERVEAFSLVAHKDKAYNVGRDIVVKLKEFIPKHMFPIPLQAGIGAKIIARENISAMKKDVLAKCYGGDVSRKRKLLQKQKEGKKKMKQMGRVSVPSDIFIKMVTR
ncbi:MAG: GTP-binding protein [Candidatus Absconditabacteria bacterium]